MTTENKQVGKSVGIHPLVIASSCDHFTRVSVGGSKLPSDAPVYGLLFGVSTGQRISVWESTEALYDFTNGKAVPLVAEIEKKIKLWTAVYTHYQLVGWYAFGFEVQQAHVAFHSAIQSFTPDPIFLLLNDKLDSDNGSDRLPLTVFTFEAVGAAGKVFVDVPFVVETALVEKISLDQIMKSTPTPGLTALEVQNQSMLSSLTTLGKKVECIVSYLEGVQAGTLKADHALIRKAVTICQMLPAVDSNQFEQKFSEEVSDALMATYLSAVTRTMHQLNQTADYYSALYGEKNVMSAGMHLPSTKF